MGSTNLKIIFFAFGLIICMITIAFMYGIITKNKEIITDESSSSTDCLYLDFKIEKVSYYNNNLTMFLKNPTTNSEDLKKINLKINNEIYSKESFIKIGETKSVCFENVTLTNDIFVYINNCVGFEKRVII